MMVVLNKEDYIREADRKLNHHIHYQKLTANLTIECTVEIKKFVDSMATRGLINKKTKKVLIPYHTRTTSFLPPTQNPQTWFHVGLLCPPTVP